MKKLFVTSLLVSFCAAALFAAETSHEGNWLTDLPKAQAKAKAEKKMVLMDFNGSDWCPPCKALKKTVLSSPEFETFAKANLVLVDVDFPRRKELPAAQTKANEDLSKKFNIEAFPTVIVLDSNGKQLSRTEGYGGESAKEFVAKLQKLKGK